MEIYEIPENKRIPELSHQNNVGLDLGYIRYCIEVVLRVKSNFILYWFHSCYMNPKALSLNEYRIIITFRLPCGSKKKQQGPRVLNSLGEKLYFTSNDR